MTDTPSTTPFSRPEAVQAVPPVHDPDVSRDSRKAATAEVARKEKYLRFGPPGDETRWAFECAPRIPADVAIDFAEILGKIGDMDQAERTRNGGEILRYLRNFADGVVLDHHLPEFNSLLRNKVEAVDVDWLLGGTMELWTEYQGMAKGKH